MTGIAQRMLARVTEDNWWQGGFQNPSGTRKCVCGHFYYEIADLTDAWYLERLHKIIAAQYPEAVDAWLSDKDYGHFSWQSLIYYFNDKIASWPDIRAVLEKAAAREQAEEGE